MMQCSPTLAPDGMNAGGILRRQVVHHGAVGLLRGGAIPRRGVGGASASR